MKIVLLLAFLLCVFAAKAQDRLVSIDAFDLGYAGGWVFRNNDPKDGKDVSSNDFRINLNYAQKISPWGENLMGKGVVRISRLHEDEGANSTNSVWGVTGGLLYNVDATDVKNSFYVGGQAGFEWQTIDDGTNDESGLNILVGAEAGKRWDMGSYASTMISYAPNVELWYRRYGGDIRDEFYTSGNEVRLNFLKFDVMF
jgi:hypothetical protein